MNLNDDNIELYLFRYKEGLLDAAEATEVERALEGHPEWQAMADLYDPDLKLPAGAAMPFADFESLRDGGPKAATRERKPIVLHDAATPRRRLTPLWTTVAAAACLLLFVTTIVKFVGGGSPVDGPITAELTTDSTKQQPVEDNATPDASAPATADNALQSIAHSDTPALLAANDESVTSNAPTTSDTPSIPVQLPAATPAPGDTNVYQLDNTTTREINDPMDQTILYADGIIIRRDAANNEPVTRREQLHSIVRRAASIAANANVAHKQRRETIEDNFENNELINNLIATLE